jgi:hypothetical protein
VCYNGSVPEVLVIGLFALTAFPGSATSQATVAQGSPLPACGHFSTGLQYPAPAWDNSVMGSVTARFDTDENGEITKLEAKGNPLLSIGAQTALRSATFSDGCLAAPF